MACRMEDGEDDPNEQVRALDRAIRWNTFLFGVNLLWEEILRSVYGDDLDMDSNTAITARNKVFDNTKAHKWNVLHYMELHVQDLIEDPENHLLTATTSREALTGYFGSRFSPENFFGVFRYRECVCSPRLVGGPPY
ncbi:hypothetical protein V8E54_006889 [Elaphomyces granulatus]